MIEKIDCEDPFARNVKYVPVIVLSVRGMNIVLENCFQQTL